MHLAKHLTKLINISLLKEMSKLKVVSEEGSIFCSVEINTLIKVQGHNDQIKGHP